MSPGADAPRETGGLGDTGAEDRDLLAAHVAGDQDAFASLVARHRDRLWAVALRTTGDREEAADGLQDGLVAAYRRAASYRGDAAVTTWLHRVVVNACLDRMRASKVRRTEPLPGGEDGERSLPREAPTGSGLAAPRRDGDPEAGAVRADERRRVLAALATLPPEQRAALVLVDMEGYGVAETAEILDCAVGTVKSRCSRGRARLAELLADLVAPGNHDATGPVPPPTRTAPPGTRPSSHPTSSEEASS